MSAMGMFGSSLTAAATPAAPAAAAAAAFQPPRAPKSLDDTGLSTTFLTELLAKTMAVRGLTRLIELSQSLALPATVLEPLLQAMRKEALVEVVRRGIQEGDQQFELTSTGRARALDWLARNAYTGPAPVTLADYTAQVERQASAKLQISRRDVEHAWEGLIVPEHLKDQLGIAVNAGRPILMHGLAGSGKTYLAERMQRLLTGTIAVPHAIVVHGEVIRVFDEHWHVPVDVASEAGPLDARGRSDARWVACERPAVIAGGELTLDMLDLQFDQRAGFYEAPLHFKANNGLFIVDDLGRQVVSPRQLMNRWIVPMERGQDYLMLRSGGKFAIPFNMVLVFASNLRPAELEDGAFLRRLGQKIEVGPLGVADYRRVFDLECGARGIAALDADFENLCALHGQHGRQLFACTPRDILTLVASRAVFRGEPARATPEALEWAWRVHFGTAAPTSA